MIRHTTEIQGWPAVKLLLEIIIESLLLMCPLRTGVGANAVSVSEREKQNHGIAWAQTKYFMRATLM